MRCSPDDIRFPTSCNLDGSDAMNPDPDYSAAYVVLKTDQPGLEGHGLTFTLGLGTELCVAAAQALAPAVIGRDLADITKDMGRFWRSVTEFRQLRWVGPEKGVLHLATAALVNAIRDLWGKAANKPVFVAVLPAGYPTGGLFTALRTATGITGLYGIRLGDRFDARADSSVMSRTWRMKRSGGRAAMRPAIFP